MAKSVVKGGSTYLSWMSLAIRLMVISNCLEVFSISKEMMINEEIRDKEVRVIDGEEVSSVLCQLLMLLKSQTRKILIW